MCECSSMAERDLPKVEAGVRFSSLALVFDINIITGSIVLCLLSSVAERWYRKP